MKLTLPLILGALLVRAMPLGLQESQKRDIDIDWPELLGPENRPDEVQVPMPLEHHVFGCRLQCDVGQLLEILTGRKARYVEPIESNDVYWEAIEKADTVPVIERYTVAEKQVWFTIDGIEDSDNKVLSYLEAPTGDYMTLAMQDQITLYSGLPEVIVTLEDSSPFAGRPQ